MSQIAVIRREVSVEQKQTSRGASGPVVTTRGGNFTLWLEGAVTTKPEKFGWPAGLDIVGVENVVELWKWSMSWRLMAAISNTMPLKIEAKETEEGWKTLVEFGGGSRISVTINLNGFRSLEDAEAEARESVRQLASEYRPAEDHPIRAAVAGLVTHADMPEWALYQLRNPML